MGEKLVVGPVNRGFRNDRTAFVIDNDSFPTLINAYQWRGRVKRKRGTTLLCRLQRFLGTTDGSGAITVTITPNPLLEFITVTVGSNVFTDMGDVGPTTTLLTNGPGTATLNRTTGLLTITGSNATTAVFYNPTIPVMGLRDLILEVNQFAGTIAFDTTYAYDIQTAFPYASYDVSYYKNPPNTTYPGYVAKGTATRTSWNGNDYQQFWTVNYQGAFWATNGISQPFSITNLGMQYYGPTTTPALTSATRISNTTMQFTVVGNVLAVGDFVFANEFTGGSGLNFQTGYVTTAGNTFTVTFPFATIAAGAYTPGILQLLTNRSDVTKDSLRWYDGDPTNGSATAPVVNGNNGWVNFAPPLSQFVYSVAELPALQYYLIGARIIQPFKDRLLFIGPVVQSSGGAPIYLRDTVIYSQNGTPYYTASYTNSPIATADTPTSPTNQFTPILVPVNQTATPSAYFEDQTGFGGYISAGYDMAITTALPNEDVLIMGFERLQARFVYTGNDIIPFNFYIINSELGSGSTFSGIILDKGVISKGSRGYVITSQVETRRIDNEIPDQVFEVNLVNNGTERVTAARDFINEWLYISYPSNESGFIYPDQTLQYNYRDDTWALFNETYTTYGQFRKSTGLTWATLPANLTWASWNDPWDSGATTLLQPDVIAGNQQGFVLVRESETTDEGNSLYIQNIVGNLVTSPNHGLNEDDYIVINGAFGAFGSLVNGLIFKVAVPTTNTFMLDPSIASGTYLGGGYIQRMYVPYIQTKQFPASWGLARKTRIGPQQYLLSTTNNGQISLLIFLSQNSANAYNDSPIVPNVNTVNNSLIYSSVLYTCPESTNLGLTPANVNLNLVTAINQEQTWHRMNTSLLGDTVQIGFTMSDDQMRDITFSNQFAEIELHGFILDLQPSQLLC